MPVTEELFREDAYLKECTATVVGVNALGGILLDRTVFYPTGGGQPGDSGVLRLADGREICIATAVKGDGEENVVHVPAEGQAAPAAGTAVTAAIDWDRRYSHMRMHTGLHLLCALVPHGVTGGRIGADKSSLDFDIGDAALDKDAITAKTQKLAEASAQLAERAYKKASEVQAGAAGAQAGAEDAAGSGKKEDVVDAEFSEVKDEKK